jgi:hypothetical protein
MQNATCNNTAAVLVSVLLARFKLLCKLFQVLWNNLPVFTEPRHKPAAWGWWDRDRRERDKLVGGSEAACGPGKSPLCQQVSTRVIDKCHHIYLSNAPPSIWSALPMTLLGQFFTDLTGTDFQPICLPPAELTPALPLSLYRHAVVGTNVSCQNGLEPRRLETAGSL